MWRADAQRLKAAEEPGMHLKTEMGGSQADGKLVAAICRAFNKGQSC